MLCRWILTVPSLMKSFSATALFLRPPAMSRRIPIFRLSRSPDLAFGPRSWYHSCRHV